MENIRIHFNVIYSSFRAETALNIHEGAMVFFDFNKEDNMKRENNQLADCSKIMRVTIILYP